MRECKTPEDRAYWAQCWRNAQANMPRRNKSLNGSPRVLRMLLGYKVGAGLSSAQHINTAKMRGDRPRNPQRQALLQMLASANGKTIARAIAINRGLDLSRWPHWD